MAERNSYFTPIRRALDHLENSELERFLDGFKRDVWINKLKEAFLRAEEMGKIRAEKFVEQILIDWRGTLHRNDKDMINIDYWVQKPLTDKEIKKIESSSTLELMHYSLITLLEDMQPVQLEKVQNRLKWDLISVRSLVQGWQQVNRDLTTSVYTGFPAV